MEPQVHRFAKMWLLIERVLLLEGPKSENVEKPMVLPLFLKGQGVSRPSGKAVAG